ncbi:hypothetical protein DFP91_1470 [Pseudorhodoplanes sinuspersici]|nr:hypothetical protein DFP91_1470 [Pseudorhodoplanes sinuspersici]
MEEILASIRRIIADDEVEKPAGLSTTPAAFQPEPVAPPPPAPPVLKPVAVAPAPKPAMPVELLQDIPPAHSRPVAAPPVSVVPSPIVEEPAADILDLTEAMRVPEQPAPFRTIEAQPDVIFAEPAPEPKPAPAMKEEPVQAYVADPFPEVRPTPTASVENPLMSNTASAAVDSAFSSLAHTVLTQNARTLDDLVKEMLRPMLKSWLDDNLPSLVERLVRAEIERVSRGR